MVKLDDKHSAERNKLLADLTAATSGVAPPARYDPSDEDLARCDPEPFKPWEPEKGVCYWLKNVWRADVGKRWSVRKLTEQLHDDIIMCGVLFIITEGITAVTCVYWRPLFWSLFWIAITVIVGLIGIGSCTELNAWGLIAFVVMQLMFSAINLQHVNALRSISVRECMVQQRHYKNCDVPSLQHCISTSACIKSEITATCHTYGACCKAPGAKECEAVNNSNLVFWINFLINFLTYAEPAFYAIILIVRREIITQIEMPNGMTTGYAKLYEQLNKGKSKPPLGKPPPEKWDWRLSLVVGLGSIGIIAFIIAQHEKIHWNKIF